MLCNINNNRMRCITWEKDRLIKRERDIKRERVSEWGKIRIKFIFIQLFVSIDSRANENEPFFSSSIPSLLFLYLSESLEMILLNVKKGEEYLYDYIIHILCIQHWIWICQRKKVPTTWKFQSLGKINWELKSFIKHVMGRHRHNMDHVQKTLLQSKSLKFRCIKYDNV